MTTSGISELFRFARLRGRTHGSASIASGWRTVCVLLLLCAASAVASPAQTFRTLVSFDGANGSEPYSSLVQGLDGNFYGTTGDGGAYGYGTIIKITRAGALTVVHSFSDGYDGADPGVLVQATDGNFYGITAGGSSAVFKISPSGTLTRLGNGFGTTGGDQIPISPSGLVQASDGNFYGTTLNGGSIADCLYRDGCGSVFKMSPSGTLTVLYAFYLFDGYGAAYPTGLVQATDGNFYGTTGDGGANGYGTVFKITPSGGLSTLYSFSGTTDGGYPLAGLVQAADGNLYGTTNAGTIFKINPGGTLTTLHTFNGTDGANPLGLVQATDGNFYGTTTIGGSTGAGTVFKMTQTGILTTLHSFNGTDGGYPYAGLVQATDGTFYGTTQAGGAHNKGTIFSLCVGLGWHTEELPGYGKVGDTIKILGTDLTGASSVSFGGIAAPYTVVSPTLIQATVPPGAKTGYVSVVLPSGKIPSNKKFRVTPQITSFSPDNGPAGTLVIITGVSLSQAKTVGISGKSTSFTVIDDTTLTATVPTGATTAKIRITTQGGTATAATNFTVD